MIKKIIFMILCISFFVVSASAQKQKNDPAGIWKFEAAYAPEGFNTGTLNVVFRNKAYSASMMFEGSDYNVTAEKVRFEKDLLNYSIFIEGQEVVVQMKFLDPLKMSGRAVYSEGEVQLTMTKVPVKAK
jgi:hypothetical protein